MTIRWNGFPGARAARLRQGLAAAVLALCVAASAAAAESATPASAEAFLRALYAPYLAGDTKVSPTGRAAPAIFDRRLTALIRKDQANAKGEVGALDGDPICDCQDFERLTELSIKVRPTGPGHAIADVRFRNGSSPSTLTYTLVAHGSGWRVADIASQDTPSLAALLTKANGMK
jgi:hypothetical protein